MAEYIEREKAFKLIKEQKEKETGAYSKGRNKGLIIAGSIINNKEVLPTADVVEVKHGEWIQEWELEKGFEDNDEIPYIKCSLCGHMEWGIDKERDITPNYCSDCGAKMDGGNK